MSDLGALRLLTRDLNFDGHGLPATVQIPDGEPVETRVIWCVPPLEEVPLGTTFSRADPQRVLAIRTDEVPTVPLKTTVLVAPMYGADVQRWIVDGFDRVELDHTRVIVVVDPTYGDA